MTNPAITAQYDGHAWDVETGPNALGYYRLKRTNTDYPHTAMVHGSELTFQPEASEVLAVVEALFSVYLNREGDEDGAENATRTALMTLGWNDNRAYRAAAHVADNR
jgi:hypothetical protein